MKTGSLVITACLLACFLVTVPGAQEGDAQPDAIVPEDDRTFVDPIQDEVLTEEDASENDEFYGDLVQLSKATKATGLTFFNKCQFKGNSHSIGSKSSSPFIVKSGMKVRSISSLKVPSGHCVTLFSKHAYKGEFLKVRGPYHVKCLKTEMMLAGGKSWDGQAASYKASKCKKEDKKASKKAVKKALLASKTTDLHKLSKKLRKKATNTPHVTKGTVKSKKRYPYHKHHIAAVAATKAHKASTVAAKKAHKAALAAAAKHKQSVKAATMALAKAWSKNNALGSVNANWYSHANVPVPWKKFHEPYPPLQKTVIAAKQESPEDDVEDMVKDAKKNLNSLGCNKIDGCATAPCVDHPKQKHFCPHYKSAGYCGEDWVKKDCQKTCNACPKVDQTLGVTTATAKLGKGGHYYLGRRRRRIGAGFGRRRRALPKITRSKGKAKGKKMIRVKLKRTPASILQPGYSQSGPFKNTKGYTGVSAVVVKAHKKKAVAKAKGKVTLPVPACNYDGSNCKHDQKGKKKKGKLVN